MGQEEGSKPSSVDALRHTAATIVQAAVETSISSKVSRKQLESIVFAAARGTMVGVAAIVPTRHSTDRSMHEFPCDIVRRLDIIGLDLWAQKLASKALGVPCHNGGTAYAAVRSLVPVSVAEQMRRVHRASGKAKHEPLNDDVASLDDFAGFIDALETSLASVKPTLGAGAPCGHDDSYEVSKNISIDQVSVLTETPSLHGELSFDISSDECSAFVDDPPAIHAFAVPTQAAPPQWVHVLDPSSAQHREFALGHCAQSLQMMEQTIAAQALERGSMLLEDFDVPVPPRYSASASEDGASSVSRSNAYPTRFDDAGFHAALGAAPVALAALEAAVAGYQYQPVAVPFPPGTGPGQGPPGAEACSSSRSLSMRRYLASHHDAYFFMCRLSLRDHLPQSVSPCSLHGCALSIHIHGFLWAVSHSALIVRSSSSAMSAASCAQVRLPWKSFHAANYCVAWALTSYWHAGYFSCSTTGTSIDSANAFWGAAMSL